MTRTRIARIGVQYLVLTILVLAVIYSYTKMVMDDDKGILFGLILYVCAIGVSIAGWVQYLFRSKTTLHFQIFLITAGSINGYVFVYILPGLLSNSSRLVTVANLVVISGLVSTTMLLIRVLKANQVTS